MGVDKGVSGVLYYAQLSELNFDLHLKICALLQVGGVKFLLI